MDEVKEEKAIVANNPTTISKSVVHPVNALNNINLLDEKQVKQAEVFLTRIMRSKKGGIATLEDGFAVLMRAQDLNLPFSTCLEHIHVINGKTGIDIHVIKSLLSKAGVTWDCIKDYTPLYEYTDGFNVYIEDKLPDFCIKCKNRKEAESKQNNKENDIDAVYVYPVLYYKDYQGNMYKSIQWNSALAIAMNQQHANELAKQGKVPVFRIPNQPVDYITEYVLYRTINGKEVKSVGKFTYSEAVAAGFFEKDNYAKYPRIMIGHRAFTLAARDIASDVLMGCYETTELKIMTNSEINDADVIDISSQIVE